RPIPQTFASSTETDGPHGKAAGSTSSATALKTREKGTSLFGEPEKSKWQVRVAQSKRIAAREASCNSLSSRSMLFLPNAALCGKLGAQRKICPTAALCYA